MIDIRPKIVASVRRRPGMTRSEFFSYIVDVHGGLTKANPGRLRRYVQNHVVDSAFGTRDVAAYAGTFHRDSVTELHFDNFPEMAETFASEYVRTVISPDGANFAELSTSEAIVTTETVLMVPPSASGGHKVLQFLYPAKDAAMLQAEWMRHHEAALEQVPEMADALVGLARADALPPSGDEMSAHFGGENVAAATLVVSLWFDDSRLPLFRQYEAAMLATGIIDITHSHFLSTRETVIFSAESKIAA